MLLFTVDYFGGIPMSKTLVLTEKPSVARDIARVLGCKKSGNGCLIGDKYIITWALGHLVTLADPEAYSDKYKSWRMEDLPMLPDKMKLVVIGQTSKQFKAVSALLVQGGGQDDGALAVELAGTEVVSEGGSARVLGLVAEHVGQGVHQGLAVLADIGVDCVHGSTSSNLI